MKRPFCEGYFESLPPCSFIGREKVQWRYGSGRSAQGAELEKSAAFHIVFQVRKGNATNLAGSRRRFLTRARMADTAKTRIRKGMDTTQMIGQRSSASSASG